MKKLFMVLLLFASIFAATTEDLMDNDATLGSNDAPVVVIEFSDFQCPFCQRFQTQTLPLIKSEYIDTGKVQFVYRDFPLTSIHSQAQVAAEAAECAKDQGYFWSYHDKLFNNQNALSVENLKSYARDLGLDTQKFNSCLDSGQKYQEVQDDYNDGLQQGVAGTPSFLVGKRGTTDDKYHSIQGAVPYSDFKQVIDGFLSGESTSSGGSKEIKVRVEDGYGNGVNDASVQLYYQDSNDGWSDASGTTNQEGHATLKVEVGKPFNLKAFTYDPYQAYGTSGGYSGEPSNTFVIKNNQLCLYSNQNDCSSLFVSLYPNQKPPVEDEPEPTVDTSSVRFSVGVNDYPDHIPGQRIDGWVNMYKVTPVSNGNYYGELIKTYKSPKDFGATFDVFYGEIVNFVAFKDYENAVSATSWTFGSPPYKHFGKGKGQLCQINYLDTSSIMRIKADNSESCATSLTTPYQDSQTTTTPEPTPTQVSVSFKVIAVDQGPAGLSTFSVKGVKIQLVSPVTGKVLDTKVTDGEGVTFNVNVGEQFYVRNVGSENGNHYGFYQELRNEGVPTYKIVENDGGPNSFNYYTLCRVSDNGCTTVVGLILYKLGSDVEEVPVPVPTERPVDLPDASFYKVEINKGWNLVSVPFENTQLDSSTCERETYYYYKLGEYAKNRLSEFGLDILSGFWFKSDGACTLKFKGEPYYSTDVSKYLYEGWNQIGAPRNSVSWEDSYGCTVKSGPYSYDTKNKKWEKASVLEPGKGYFVKMASDCKLTFEDFPPLPE